MTKKIVYKKALSLAIYLCMFWKAFCPFLGFAYLFAWILMVLGLSSFRYLDEIIGYFPRVIDTFFPHQTDLFGQDFPMGYIYCAATTIVTMYFAMKAQTKLVQKRAKIVDIERKQKERLEKTIKRAKEKIPKTNLFTLTNFYGLFELNLKYMNPENKSKEDLIRLESEYLKMLCDNLSKKYANVKFDVSNRLFFVSNDFLIFDPLLIDIMKLYSIFVELDREKFIKTELLLSFAAGNNNNSDEYIKNFLKKINYLGYANKVIVVDKFIEKYKSLKGSQFKLHSLGMSKVETDTFKEIDVELSYLKKG